MINNGILDDLGLNLNKLKKKTKDVNKAKTGCHRLTKEQKIQKLLKEISDRPKDINELQNLLINIGVEKNLLIKNDKEIPEDLMANFEIYRRIYKEINKLI